MLMMMMKSVASVAFLSELAEQEQQNEIKIFKKKKRKTHQVHPSSGNIRSFIVDSLRRVEAIVTNERTNRGGRCHKSDESLNVLSFRCSTANHGFIVPLENFSITSNFPSTLFPSSSTRLTTA